MIIQEILTLESDCAMPFAKFKTLLEMTVFFS